MSACPLGTPAGAGPLIGWVRGPKSEIEVSFAGQDEPTHFVLTRHDNTAFDGHDFGFFSSDTLGRIWLWTEAQLVVGREGRGVGGNVPDAAGAVALAFGLDSDNHLVFACYKGVKHPTASDSSDMANLMVRLVHVTPVSVLDGPPLRPEAAEEMPNSSTSADIVDRPQTFPNWELLTLNDLAQVEVPLLATTTRSAYQLQPRADNSPITSAAEPPERRSLLGVALSQSAAKTAVAAATVSWVVARITRACARSLRNTAEMIVRPARQPDRPPSITSNRGSIRGHLRFAIAAMVLLAGGMGGWAATTELSGAVIAMGQLVVDSNVKKIQHPFGGVIAELHVRDGDRVNAGEVLVRLDGTETRANLAIVSKALDQLSALQARDQAMRDGVAEVSFPPELLDRAQDPVIAELIKGERRLFDALISGANGRKAQLREQVAQFDEQTRGMQKQLEAKAEEIDWNAQELVGIRDLWKQKLIDFARVTTAERDAARLEGEHGALVSSIAELKGKIAETHLRILQVDEDMRTDVGKELADVRGKIAELVEKKVAAEDRLQRLEIRAPQSGIIHELEFHTVGGVI